jgi:acetyl-CoA carboxylase biotin carboxylase subunit
MRVVEREKDIERMFKLASNEAEKAFNNPEVFIEKFVREPRHIEFQILADKHGNVIHLGERECSVQRKHQKLLEESPSPALDEKLRKKMGEAAIRIARSVNYYSAGTVEFLLDENNHFSFMEMNTRIQVEHPVTEEVTNFDLIKEQIKVAAGEKVSGKHYYPQLYAMECRINAEDPSKDFRPNPGKIQSLHIPGGQGVRVDSHVYAGYTIPPNYDSMIAKLIVSAQSREECIVRMSRALDEFIIEGIKTTIPFHKKLMKDEIFRSGRFTTDFLNGFDFSDL